MPFFFQYNLLLTEKPLQRKAPDKLIIDDYRKNLNSTLYANSLIGVGVASSLYHSSRGQARKYLRWADYTMIAATTLVSWYYLENHCDKSELIQFFSQLIPFLKKSCKHAL